MLLPNTEMVCDLGEWLRKDNWCVPFVLGNGDIEQMPGMYVSALVETFYSGLVLIFLFLWFVRGWSKCVQPISEAQLLYEMLKIYACLLFLWLVPLMADVHWDIPFKEWPRGLKNIEMVNMVYIWWCIFVISHTLFASDENKKKKKQ